MTYEQPGEPAEAPAALVASAQAAWARLDRSLGGLTDDEARAPSALPGWTRAHVVAHLWGNAEGLAGATRSSVDGGVGVQYPGGPDQRSRDIEGRARLPLDVVVDGAREAHRSLADAWADADEADAWGNPVEVSGGGYLSILRTVASRRREIVVHHVDLAVAFGPEDLPPDYVAADAAWLAEHRPDW